jgi:hypothetical protein
MLMIRPNTGRVRWFLIFWLFILSAVAFLDRVSISIAGSSIAAAYQLSHVQLGTVFSALLWGYPLFQPLGGRLADRIRTRRLLPLAVLWWGSFTALTAGLPMTGGAISDWLTRRYGRRFGRCVLASIVIFGTAFFLLFGSRVQNARLASVVLAGGAAVQYLAQSLFWSVTADIAGRSSGSVSAS